MSYTHHITTMHHTGNPVTLKNAVCLHEEDHGILWKHLEYRNNHAEVRRSRRLVLSFVCTVVNYVRGQPCCRHAADMEQMHEREQ